MGAVTVIIQVEAEFCLEAKITKEKN